MNETSTSVSYCSKCGREIRVVSYAVDGQQICTICFHKMGEGFTDTQKREIREIVKEEIKKEATIQREYILGRVREW